MWTFGGSPQLKLLAHAAIPGFSPGQDPMMLTLLQVNMEVERSPF